MKKNDFKRFALMGVATGVLLTQSGVEAIENNNAPIDLDYVLAKPSCKAHGGCGGLTADSDRNNTTYQDDTEIVDPNIPEDTFEDDKKVK